MWSDCGSLGPARCRQSFVGPCEEKVCSDLLSESLTVLHHLRSRSQPRHRQPSGSGQGWMQSCRLWPLLPVLPQPWAGGVLSRMLRWQCCHHCWLSQGMVNTCAASCVVLTWALGRLQMHGQLIPGWTCPVLKELPQSAARAHNSFDCL